MVLESRMPEFVSHSPTRGSHAPSCVFLGYLQCHALVILLLVDFVVFSFFAFIYFLLFVLAFGLRHELTPDLWAKENYIDVRIISHG
jgi:hypothetical protein